MPGKPKKRARRAQEAKGKAASRAIVEQTRAPASEPSEALKGTVVRSDWQAVFLRTFADTGNIRASLEQCEVEGVKVSRQTMENERSRNEGFRELYVEAEKMAVGATLETLIGKTVTVTLVDPKEEEHRVNTSPTIRRS